MTGLFSQVYHVDVYMPEDIEEPEAGHALRYTVHAEHEAKKDHVEQRLPLFLPAFTLIEVTTFAGQVVNWVVRTPVTEHKDLVLVILRDYTVKTVWVNRKDDNHATLRTERYARRPDAELQEV